MSNKQLTITIKEIATLFETSANSSTNINITGISTNASNTKPGDIFVCLTNEKIDGHQLIKEAESNGALAILAEKKVYSSMPVIYVKDTLKAIEKLKTHLEAH